MRVFRWRFFLPTTQQDQPRNQSHTDSSILEPIYTSLAEQIVAEFHLPKKKEFELTWAAGI